MAENITNNFFFLSAIPETQVVSDLSIPNSLTDISIMVDEIRSSVNAISAEIVNLQDNNIGIPEGISKVKADILQIRTNLQTLLPLLSLLPQPNQPII